MTRIPAWIAVVALLVLPQMAMAQEPDPPIAGRPRVELGAAGTFVMMGDTVRRGDAFVDTRVGVALGRRWSVEGIVHFWVHEYEDPGANCWEWSASEGCTLWAPPPADAVRGLFRGQLRWRVAQNSFHPFVAFGIGSQFENLDAGIGFFLTGSAGIEKVLARHLAFRAEVTGMAVGGPGGGLSASIGVSIPLGSYPTKR